MPFTAWLSQILYFSFHLFLSLNHSSTHTLLPSTHQSFYQFHQKMAKKRLPFFHKVSNVLRISVLIHKLRKPIIPKLLLFKKLTKHKEFKLLIKNYNYGFSRGDHIRTNPKEKPQTEPIQTENRKNHIWFGCIWMTFLLNCEPQKPQTPRLTALNFYYIPILLKPH